jgi:hypothetical protein
MRIARVESRVLTYSPEHAEDSCSRRIEPRQRREAPRWRRGDGVLVATPASAKDRGGGSVHDGHVDAEVRGSSRGHGSGSQSPSARSSPGFRDRNLSPRYINSRSSLVVLKIVGSQLGYAARTWSRILVMGADDSTRGIAICRASEAATTGFRDLLHERRSLSASPARIPSLCKRHRRSFPRDHRPG